MTEFCEGLANLSVLVFVVSCTAAAGLGLSVRDVGASLRRGRLLVLAVTANFVVAPAVAYGLTATVPLPRPYSAGLLLLGAAAGAPFLPKLAGLARGDAAFSVALMLVLTVGSVVFVPLALPALIPGLSARPWPLLRPLLVTMLLPLGGGMVLRGRSERWASRLRPGLGAVSNASMILAVLLLTGLNGEAMLGTFGSGAVAVAVLFVSVALATGYLLGGPAPGTRSVLGLGTGQRNIAAALVVATQNFADPGVVAMLLVSTLAGLVVLLPAARWFARRAAPAGGPGEPAAGLVRAPAGPSPQEVTR